MKSDKPDILLALEPLLVDVQTASALLGVSRSHFLAMEKTGKIGFRGIEVMGNRKLYSVEEIKSWVRAGCPNRLEWQNNHN